MEHQSLEQFFRTPAEDRSPRARRRGRGPENPLFKVNPVRPAFYHPEALAIAVLVGGAWAWALYSLIN